MKTYIEEAADFISKDCKRMKAGKLKEDKYQTVDDELNAVINGGWDDFEADEDLMNPEKADAIHKNAQAAGMSDLDYVNREEALDSIEDDWAYELETQDYYPTASDISEVISNCNIRDVYDEEAASIADKGYANGSYGSQIKDGPALLEDIMEGIVQYIGDELPRPSYDYTSFGQKVIQEWLDASAKYVGNPVTPKCEAFHNGLVVLAQEYNDLLQNVLGNPEWPEAIVVPAANGKVDESTKGNTLKSLKEAIAGSGKEAILDSLQFSFRESYARDPEVNEVVKFFKPCSSVQDFSNACKAYDAEGFDIMPTFKFTKGGMSMYVDSTDSVAFWDVYIGETGNIWLAESKKKGNKMKKPTSKKKINEAMGPDMNLTARIKIGSGWGRDDVMQFADELRAMIERPGESIDFHFPTNDEIKFRVNGFAQAEDVLEYSFETARDLGLSVPVKVSFEI